MKTCLLIINPQRDFIDDRDAALPIKGAFNNMLNLTDMLYQYGNRIDQIVVTLDQHPFNHIAHPEMWLDKRDCSPRPFSRITYADISIGRWRASLPELEQIQADYVREAEKAGAGLTVWPRHCIIGSRGASICPRLNSDLTSWANPNRLVHFYNLSANWSTEHISSFQTVVNRNDDGTTWFNHYLYQAIQADTILIAGEALDHQVKATVLEAIDYAPQIAASMIILEDCTSSMHEKRHGEKFLNEFTNRGGQLSKADMIFQDIMADC